MASRAGRTGRGGRGGRTGRGRGDRLTTGGSVKRARKSVVDQIKEGSKQIIGDKPETGMTLKAAKKKFSEKQGKRHDGGEDKQRTKIDR